MPLVSCITINQCGKRQASFVRWLVNFPDSFARLDKLLELQQHCEQQTSGSWILLTSLPISGSGAAGVHLSGTGSQNHIWARFVEEKLGLGASGRLEGKKAVSSSSWLEILQANPASQHFGSVYLWVFLLTLLQ